MSCAEDHPVYIVIYNKRDDYGFGQPLRVLYRTTPDVARRFCSDPRTMGKNYFCGWTYVYNQPVQWVKDDGRFEQVIDELGIREHLWRPEQSIS